MATVSDTSFLRNAVTYCGAALCIFTNDAATINLHNVYFLESSAGDAIVEATAPKESSTFSLSMTNVIFVQNKLPACSPLKSTSV